MPRRSRALILTPIALALVGGCTEHVPDEESLQYRDPLTMPSRHLAIPEGERVVVEAPAPIPTRDFDVSPPRFSMVDLDPDEAWECEFELLAHGLPAVRRDGTALAYVEEYPPGGADGPLPSTFIIEGVLEGSSVERRSLGEGEMYDPSAAEDPCPAYRARLAERIEAYNLELEDYRPLQQLDVITTNPERDYDDPAETIDPTTVVGRERPVQALYHAGWFVMRVPGIRVLTRQAKTHWRIQDDYCQENPNLVEVWGDPTTGLGVTLVDHISGACLCDDGEYFHPITVPARVFAEVEARPAATYRERIEALLE